MKLRTEINIEPFTEQIDYQSRIITIGSCFADRVGHEMSRSKLRVTVNPMGVLFNPISVASTLERIAECRKITAEELRCGDEGYYHFGFHSSLSSQSAESTVEQINRAIERGHEALIDADWVVITLGTAWVYELAESGEVVANCHKVPAREFNRRRMGVAEVVESLRRVIDGALSGKHIVLTVSPIRHIADGLAENSLSKATLRLAIDEVVAQYERVHYFPSYEIMLDDLRDYRFYDRDMVHVSDTAVEYIWDKFCETALSNGARELLPQVMKIMRAAEHRPFNSESEAHQKFINSQLKAIERLKEVNFSEERSTFCNQLKIIS